MITGLGASSVDWEVRGWARREDFLKVRQGLIGEVKQALDAAGIAIPFPQIDVHLEPAPQEGARE